VKIEGEELLLAVSSSCAEMEMEPTFRKNNLMENFDKIELLCEWIPRRQISHG